MSNRVSNFKRETATDTKQDGEISTLTTTLNNFVIPNQSIISPNVINLGGVGGVKIQCAGSDLVLGANMNNSLTTWMKWIKRPSASSSISRS